MAVEEDGCAVFFRDEVHLVDEDEELGVGGVLVDGLGLGVCVYV